MNIDFRENFFMNAEDLSKLLKPDMTVIEVGSYVGRSTVFFADKVKKVYAIDHWLGSPGESHLDIPRNCLEMYDQFLTNIGQHNNIEPIRAWSTVGLRYLFNKEVKPDLIYIDAGHTYEDVTVDLEHANKFSNTIICGDDYGWGNGRPIEQAVIDFCNKHQYDKIVKRDWFYQIIRN